MGSGRAEHFSIRTVVELIDDDQVIDLMAREIADETAARWRELNRNILPVEDLDREWERNRREKYDQISHSARDAICLARRFAEWKALENVRNFRDKYIAHALAQTYRERDGPLPLPKRRDPPRLLRVTRKILEGLSLCVRNHNPELSNSRRIARKSAEALWQGVKIRALR